MNLWEFLNQCSFGQWLGVLTLAFLVALGVAGIFPLFVIRPCKHDREDS